MLLDLKLDEDDWDFQNNKLIVFVSVDQSSDEKEPVLYDSYSANVDIFLVFNVAVHLKIDYDILGGLSNSKVLNLESQIKSQIPYSRPFNPRDKFFSQFQIRDFEG